MYCGSVGEDDEIIMRSTSDKRFCHTLFFDRIIAMIGLRLTTSSSFNLIAKLLKQIKNNSDIVCKLVSIGRIEAICSMT